MQRKMDAKPQFFEPAPHRWVNMCGVAAIQGEPLRRNEPMKLLLSVVAVVGPLATPDASAQVVDLNGPYRCVQMCREGLTGPAFVTQSGWDLNLVNEAGEPSRAWIDRPGHIWAPGWNQGAIYAPDGMIIQFDRGTVWQRDLGPPEVVVVPRGRAARRDVPPPLVESAPPPPRAAPRAAAPAERTAV